MCCKQWTLREWIYFLRATPTLTLEFAFDSRSAHWELGFAVQARQCPLKSGARSWSREIWHSRSRSGTAHWHPELAVETRGCRRRRRRRRASRRRREEEEEEKTTRTRIKSRDPHLAGGEKGKTQYGWNKHNPKIHTNELTRTKRHQKNMRPNI